jgi:hypothetical protein
VTTDRFSVQLFNPQQGYAAMRAAWPRIKEWLDAGMRLVVEVRPETRSDAQNRRLWAMLHEISQQVNWHGNKLTDEEWKDVFSAALKRQKVVPGLDGGFVVCGQRTSKMTKAEMSEMQELMAAFGAERGVIFSEGNE